MRRGQTSIHEQSWSGALENSTRLRRLTFVERTPRTVNTQCECGQNSSRVSAYEPRRTRRAGNSSRESVASEERCAASTCVRTARTCRDLKRVDRRADKSSRSARTPFCHLASAITVSSQLRQSHIRSRLDSHRCNRESRFIQISLKAARKHD